jgi:asparagine synthase (glutamine-hydrolysing)
MFAFIIYDRELDNLFVARDRFGVKPLYYWISPKGIAFASEIKQFLQLPEWKSILNNSRAYDFLAWGITDHTDETLFKGVYQLRGGHAFEYKVKQLRNASTSSGRLPVYKWYELVPKIFAGNYKKACVELRERFIDAVRLRLRSDVPVGSCLSGGVDSSSIVCVANDLLREQGAHENQKTFSACSHYSKFDERKYIDKVVAHSEVAPFYNYPELDNLFELIDKITWHQDEPFSSTSIYAQWCVFKLAAENGVKVMLDGQGSDEQLAGYHSFIAPRLISLIRKMKWVELFREVQALESIHRYSKWHLTKLVANSTIPKRLKQKLRQLIGKANITPKWLNLSILKTAPSDPHVLYGNGDVSIQNLSRAQVLFTNLPMLLHWEDRDSMAHSIESRVPFMDYRLVEFSFGLPDEFKLSGGITKRVLRDSMAGILPEEIKNRMDKLGFVTPEEVWVKETGTDKFREALRESIALSKGILNDYALDELEEIINGQRVFSFQVWRMICFGIWMKTFDVSLEESTL